MINVVMTVRDRPRLVYQSLWTLMNHSRYEIALTVVDDCSISHIRRIVAIFESRFPRITVLRVEQPCDDESRLRNLGAWWAERQQGRGDYLYFSSGDIWFTPGWDKVMQMVYETGKENQLAVLGGQRYPPHKPLAERLGWLETHQVTGDSLWMRWDVWDLCGPFPAQEEDFCEAVKTMGWKVGYMQEPTLRHTRLTAAKRTWTQRWERHYGGVLYE